VLPFTFASRSSINFALVADSMFEILFPHTNIHSVVLDHGSFAPLLAILELTVVLTSIGPHLLALPVHLTILKVAVVGHFVLSKVVLAIAVECILHKSAFEIATVLPCKMSFALFKVLQEISFESAVGCLPGFSAMSIKLVVFPNAFIFVALIRVKVNSVAICCVILPLTVVVFAVKVDQAAFSLPSSVLEFALVHRAVLVLQNTYAIEFIRECLAPFLVKSSVNALVELVLM
jgi:hypothetical protein